MTKFSSKDRNEYLELPVKITYEGKDYWVKRATKTSGIYMNDVPPKQEIVISENEFIDLTLQK